MQKEIGLAPSILISFSIIILYIIFSLKRILICLVRIYQRFAPSSLRMKCRFEPSCSQYMILALEKYGAFKGLKLGIKRLTRCKVGNGGYDYP
ncbi:MAG: membrane protein insertion efficiency factor YidD [Lachnospiraceae bacterium]|nr:membrane protein insertion efficiency factor YidD [Lachnospiraceae bacterium]